MTAALSLAATPLDVSNTCLEHALASIGAEAGFVVLNSPDGRTVELVTATRLRGRRARSLARARPGRERSLQPRDGVGRSDLGSDEARDVRVHAGEGGSLRRLGDVAARDAIRSPGRAARLVATPASVQRRRARVAPVDGVPVRTGSRAQRDLRRGAALAAARRAASGYDRTPVERPHPGGRRTGRRGRGERGSRGGDGRACVSRRGASERHPD